MTNPNSVAVLRVLENFASAYSPDSENGQALRAAIAALSAQGEEVATVEAWSHGETYLHWHTSAMEFPAGTKLYLHPAPPVADAVTEAEIDRVLEAYYAPHGMAQFDEVQRACKRAAMKAALAARTGQGEANGR